MFYNRIWFVLVFPAIVLMHLPARAQTSNLNGIASSPTANSQTNHVKPAAFEVRRYDVVGNTLLRQELIDRIFTNAIGPAVTLEEIRKSLGELQLAYRERGYVTVGLNLPQQQLSNATVKIDVTEAKLADIRVKGNRYYSSNNVRGALPSLRTNILLNSFVFQRELDQANQNRDRQIYPTIGPGPLPGTSALTLRVKDRLPFHARVDLDDYATPGTPDLRINLAAQYNNLWQQDHQFGLSYGFSPERGKANGLASDYLFNEPQISYYGAYYRIPFGPASVADAITNSTGFGYNEATHQFNLPPSGDRPDFTFFASASGSDTGIKYGELQTITNTATESVASQTSGRNYSANADVGVRFTLPLITTAKTRWSAYSGLDFKHSALTVYSTNTDITQIFFDPSTGTAPIPPIINSSASLPMKTAVNYLPLILGLSFSEEDSGGSSSFDLSGSVNFVGGSANFVANAYTTKAQQDFGKANLSFSREQKLPRDWSLLFRGGAQGATGPLISNEQFPVGGYNSVRGYFEGDDYGDAGWFGSAELRTPYFKTQVASVHDFVPTWLRASVFVDYGQRYLLEAPVGSSCSRSLLGTGFGLSANVNNHVEAKLAVGWALFDSANTRAGDARVYFTIGGQF